MALIELNTPALLFPAVSLLMLAYTNRYLALANLIRKLHSDYVAGQEPHIRAQIENLRFRMRLIRAMQTSGLFSVFFCLCSMTAVMLGFKLAGTWLFGVAVLTMIVSIVQSIREVARSEGALDILLCQMERAEEKHGEQLQGKGS
jgi:hypothetical protein